MMNTDYFMLLSPSANRDKSWACEHCPNWITKDKSICQSCYYAFPEKYTHIAGIQERKINIVFRNQDIDLYEQIAKQANMENISIQDFIKRIFEYYAKLSSKKFYSTEKFFLFQNRIRQRFSAFSSLSTFLKIFHELSTATTFGGRFFLKKRHSFQNYLKDTTPLYTFVLSHLSYTSLFSII